MFDWSLNRLIDWLNGKLVWLLTDRLYFIFDTFSTWQTCTICIYFDTICPYALVVSICWCRISYKKFLRIIVFWIIDVYFFDINRSMLNACVLSLRSRLIIVDLIVTFSNSLNRFFFFFSLLYIYISCISWCQCFFVIFQLSFKKILIFNFIKFVRERLDVKCILCEFFLLFWMFFVNDKIKKDERLNWSI